jgi:serine/threonine-protein kinase RsbT
LADQTTDRVLVIVEREDLARYASLKRVFASESVDVILDRRRGERREHLTPPPVDRRGGDRRVRSIAQDLQTLGWALVRREVKAALDSILWAAAPGMQPARIRSEVLLQISSETDVVSARDRARELAGGIGLSPADSAIVATAVSELARNVVAYATRGEVIFRVIEAEHARGLEIVAVDEGPGIADIELALQDGYSTGRGLGLGLPGVRRLMDHFHIASKLNKGTTVTIRKWRR